MYQAVNMHNLRFMRLNMLYLNNYFGFEIGNSVRTDPKLCQLAFLLTK